MNNIVKKIEIDIVTILDAKYTSKTTMKPTYKFDADNNYWNIKYNDKTYILDLDEFEKLINSSKKFKFIIDTDVYPSYNINSVTFNLLEYLYKLREDCTNFTFKNDNIYDLRKENVITRAKVLTRDNVLVENIIFNNLLEERQYKILEIITNGHIPIMGKCAGKYKNPIYKCINDKNKEQLIMYCETETLCIVCQESLNKITEFEKIYNDGKKLVFYKHSNGYILCSNENLYMHQIITNCYGNGKGTKEISVDHIDQDPLNNTFANLRLASRKDQEDNSKGIKDGTKRARKHNAKDLPSGITQDMMRKYVVYYEECYDKANDLHREFFKIESHPKLDKIYISSKSNKVSIQTKLAEVNKVVDDLDNDIFPIQDDKQLPTYITLKITRDKPHLVFDKKCDDGRRLNFKMVLRPDYKLDEMLPIFREKIKEKYDIVV